MNPNTKTNTTSLPQYDVVIIGSGISGIYAAYKIQKTAPNTSFLILEKYKKQWIGGRTSNELFYGTQIATGAGIGRKKDVLLRKLLEELDFEINEFTVNASYSKYVEPVNVKKIVQFLRKEYEKYRGEPVTFREFAKPILGEKVYKQFLLTTGYTDYEKEGAFETLHIYGMEDNAGSLPAFSVQWRNVILALTAKIGESHFKFSHNVTSISGCDGAFLVETDEFRKYTCKKVIVATTISSIRSFFRNPIYKEIEGQPFLRMYGKFAKQSIPIMKEYVKSYICLTGPLQKIIPINPDEGVYMIAYNDNKNAIKLKPYTENTAKNRELYCDLIEKALGIPTGRLHLIGMRSFYWAIGTHYYKPLDQEKYKDRDEFIRMAQHPENGIVVVGEVVSKNQGWVEGALRSVDAVVTKKWIDTI